MNDGYDDDRAPADHADVGGDDDDHDFDDGDGGVDQNQ